MYMKTIKINDNGVEVVILQHLLGIATDGIFGQQTENALKMFQSHNRMEVDGVCGNKTWNALLGYQLKRSARKINEIIIHCTATQEGTPYTVEQIRQYHKQSKGWKDIGYHYVIYLDGSVHNGRDVDFQGAHCKYHNANSIGICYVGGVGKDGKNKDTRTPAQKKAMYELIYIMKTLYPNATIHGHKEFEPRKDCPCFDAFKEYNNIKTK